MKRYRDLVYGMSPSTKGAGHVADIVAALAPPAKAEGADALAKTAPDHSKPSAGEALKAMAPGLAGAAAGAYTWKKHRVLGALLGHAVGASAKDLYKGDRNKALTQMGVEGAGVAGALYYSKHPVLGYVGGLLAGTVASIMVPGSYMRDKYNQWRKK